MQQQLRNALAYIEAGSRQPNTIMTMMMVIMMVMVMLMMMTMMTTSCGTPQTSQHLLYRVNTI